MRYGPYDPGFPSTWATLAHDSEFRWKFSCDSTVLSAELVVEGWKVFSEKVMALPETYMDIVLKYSGP